MANKSYIVKEYITIERQEGDTGSLEFIIPNLISLTNMTLRFHVHKKTKTGAGDLVFKKEGKDWIVTGQHIEAPLNPSDTEGYAGSHWWELEARNEDDDPVITLGKGTFTILQENIKSPEGI